ncbi:hypothetical protein HH800_26715 (plasmid) [Sphingobium yanoikuyae]|jgi:hypothetical protein|uniref:MBL fold metallo-hydrolase n=1 Tax=Sphingobium yanoikuyae TaxID=13690 RepID=A0A6M4GHJ0_SPHYA|nr:hypothetical protein [Sphingobium yanoikuyae]QJR05833.1 hypothetical protein HH800_26715 [Sphingobium yanoikuyae]
MKQLADDFWNFRGRFKIAGLIDVGTHMSLVRRRTGRFLLIDSYGVSGADRDALLKLTDNGAAIDAIINVHPFHTLHCRAAHEVAPGARLFGTQRHRDQAPELPWEKDRIEDGATQAQFDELAFSVPDGLDLVTSDESVHAASVLVRHRPSGIVHVDDTLMVLAAPGLLRYVLPQSRMRFHPRLAKALQHRAGAADDFTSWARGLAESWAGTRIVCAAHSAVRQFTPNGWHDEMTLALSDVQKMLDQHRSRHG